MRILRLSLLTLGTFGVAASALPAQTVVSDPGTTYEISDLTGFTTGGAGMNGMSVSAFFTDGSSSGGAWSDLGGGNSGFSSALFTLSFASGGDTFSDSWSLVNLYGSGLSRLILDGVPGGTVFDRDVGFGTTGSFSGRDFIIGGGDLNRTIATYRNQVRIMGEAIAGDLFTMLDVEFGIALASDLTFQADTDNIPAGGFIRPDPTVVPEPATMVLFASGLVALGGARFARRRRSADEL